MADFLPKFLPGQRWSATTSAAVTGGKLLAVSGDNTVAHAGAASLAVVGVAAFDTASGGVVTVYSPKIAVLVSTGTITAGDRVIAGAAGVVVTLGAGDANAVVGIALTTAAGNRVKVYFTG